GPRDTISGDGLGGNKFYVGSLALGVPLGLPKALGITGRAFTAFGSLWPNGQKNIVVPTSKLARTAGRRPVISCWTAARTTTASGRRGHLVEIAGRTDPPRRRDAAEERAVRPYPALPCEFRHEVLMLALSRGSAPLIFLVTLWALIAPAEAQPAKAQAPAAAPP